MTSLNINSDGSNLEMKWSCGHQGFLNLDWLRKHSYSSKVLEEGRKKISPLFATQMPQMDYKELEDDYGVWKWLKNVNEYGVCLLHGVPCTKEDGLEVSKKICPYLQETFYGGLTELKVEDSAISVSYGHGALEPHQDMPEYESYTGITLIHCLRNDRCVAEGESVIVDGLAVVEKLRKTHPHYFDTLVRVPATFHRINHTWDRPIHMVYKTPHIHLNGHGQVIMMRWSTHHDGPLQVNEEDVEPYYEAYAYLAKAIMYDKECQFHHRLEPGDMFTLNNHRMLHGRMKIQLNGGTRHLANFSLNIDEFKSTFHWLCTKYDPDYQPRNVLNNDFSFSSAVTSTA
jgi:gamma-butyrobetaine dioxygenase